MAEGGQPSGQNGDGQALGDGAGVNGVDVLSNLDPAMHRWAAANHFSVETVTTLVNQGFVNLELCSLVSGDVLAELSSQVRPLAQQLALRGAIKKLTNSNLSSTSTHQLGGALDVLAQAASVSNLGTDPGHGGVAVNPIPVPPGSSGSSSTSSGAAGMLPIDNLLNHMVPPGVGAVNQASQSHLEGASLFLRPLADVNYLKIIDFIRPVLGTSIRDEDEKLGDCDGGTLLFRPHKTQKKKLDQVTKEQWFAAALRIMDTLTRTAKLPASMGPDYLGYLVFITDLAQQYLWQDVLAYDDNYRREQAKLQCEWGYPIPTLNRLWLRPKSMGDNNVGHKSQFSRRSQNTSGAANSGPRVPQRGPMDPQTGKEICLAFNKGACRFGTECRYAHMCSIPACRKPHARSQHQNQTFQSNSA
jgi:hypothetical protein